MDDTSPKISFIPKASLVREQSFLERPRPRSAFGILASLVFVAAAGSYIGLYFYNNSLEQQIAAKLGEIQNVQKVFSASPQVGKATSFSFRAEIVQGLLSAHVAITPILKFLSENTLRSVMYNEFSFVKDENGVLVTVTGEAPSYAALVYQREVLRQKTKELSNVVVSDINLTPFGTVSFNLALTFTPEYLSYAKLLNATQADTTNTPAAMNALTKMLLPPVAATSSIGLPGAITFAKTGTTTNSLSASSFATSTSFLPGTSTSTNNDLTQTRRSVPSVSTTATEQSWQSTISTILAKSGALLSSFWQWFKFW